MTGTVCWFSGSYGFITPDEGTNDIFVHHKGIKCKGWKTLDVGQRVTYTLDKNSGGLCAVNVEVTND